MIKASDNPRAFKDMIAGIVAEHDHPDLCQEFGINIGLTERDFEEMVPVYECCCTRASSWRRRSSTPVRRRAGRPA